MVLERFITRERLEVGLLTSARTDEETACTCCGLFLLVLSGVAITFIEGNLVYEERELAEARQAFEVDCYPGAGTAYDGHALHLTGCPVSGAIDWSHELFSVFDNGTEVPELGYFESNFVDLPNDITGVRFAVNVRMYSRRRSASWDDVDGASNIPAVDLIVNGASVGAWNASNDIVEAFPMRRVPLKPSPLYRDTYGQGALPERLDSTCMKVHNDALYWAADPKNPDDDDVMVFFTVANEKAVSVVAAEDNGKRLVQWTSSQETDGALLFEGYKLGLVEPGSVSLRTMLGHADAEFRSDAGASRGIALLMAWLGLFFAMFAGDAVPLCAMLCSSRDEASRYDLSCKHLLYALCSSWVASVFIVMLMCASAALAFRSPLVLLAGAALLVLALGFAGAFGGRAPTEAQPPAAAAGYESLAGEAPPVVSPAPASGEGAAGPEQSGKRLLKMMVLGAALGICSAIVVAVMLGALMG